MTSIIRQAEKDYFSNKILEAKNNLAKTWKILNNITNRTTSKNNIDQIEKDGSIIDNPLNIAEKFINFFVNVGPNLAKKITPSNINPTDFLEGNYCNSMFLEPTTDEEICDIISNLKNSNSTGHDNISITLIKSCKIELSSILSHVNNQSLSEGIFPDPLKIAKVVPIYKNGNIKCVSNYRPISVLSSLSKITEKLVYIRLEKYIIKNSILHQNQFGFRSKLSTSMALLELVDKLSKSIDDRKLTVGVFIDLAKAFDTVDHRILLSKMEHYGIRGVALNWFQNYLTNRKQYVTIDNANSSEAYIKCGVPQGSILGPLLFLIYINDLNYVSKLLNTIMFADDTNLFLTGKSLTELEQQMNTELEIINNWFQTNLLSLNVSKTSYIIFSNNKIPDINICIQDACLSRQFDTKFLGVILSANLKWNKHIEVVSNKISKNVGIISKVRHIIPPHLTRSLYLTLVEPYISYCNLVWSSHKNTEILNCVLKLQKRYVRLITFSDYSAHSKPLFLKLNILTVYQIYNSQLAIYMYKIQNNLIPRLGHHHFISNMAIHDYNTRSNHHLHIPYCRTKMRQNTIQFQGPKLWNLLPEEIKSAPSVNIFKKRIRTYINNCILD